MTFANGTEQTLLEQSITMYNVDMSKYGESKKDVPSQEIPERDMDKFTPYTELCKFADEYELRLEIEKPFVEMENLFLKVIDRDTGEEVKRVMLNDISSLNDEAATVLNELSSSAYKT